MRLAGLPLMATPTEAAIAFVHGALVLSAGLFLFGQGSRLARGGQLFRR